MPTLGVNWDKGACARTALSLGGGNEETDPSAEHKAVSGRQALGNHREDSHLCRVAYRDAWERNGDHHLLHGSETKGRDQPAAGGDTHLSRVHAGRRFPENAEVINRLRLPEGFGSTRLLLPGVPAAVRPEALFSLGQAKPTASSEPRGDVMRSAHRPPSAPGQPSQLPFCACAGAGAARSALRGLFRRRSHCFSDFMFFLGI